MTVDKYAVYIHYIALGVHQFCLIFVLYIDCRRRSVHHSEAVRDVHRVAQTGCSNKYNHATQQLCQAWRGVQSSPGNSGGLPDSQAFILQTCRAGKKNTWTDLVDLGACVSGVSRGA